MKVSNQKYIRTGDVVVDKKTKLKKVIHHIINSFEKISYEEQFANISKIITFDGEKNETFLPSDLIFKRG